MKHTMNDSALDSLIDEVVSRTVGEQSSQGRRENKLVTIGADHRGLDFKAAMIETIEKMGFAVEDCGVAPETEAADYPEIAERVALPVAEGRAWRGIVIDGAGIGSAIAANKIPGVRAALCYNQATAANSREHNNVNVLSLGSGMVGIGLAQKIVATWLTTDFGGGRHAKRVDKITEMEARYRAKTVR